MCNLSGVCWADAVSRVPEAAAGVIEGGFLAANLFSKTAVDGPHDRTVHDRRDGPAAKGLAVPGTPAVLRVLVLMPQTRAGASLIQCAICGIVTLPALH